MKIFVKILKFFFVFLFVFAVYVNTSYKLQNKIESKSCRENTDFETFLSNGIYKFGEIINNENSLTSLIYLPKLSKTNPNLNSISDFFEFINSTIFPARYVLFSKFIFLKICDIDLIFPFNYFW